MTLTDFLLARIAEDERTAGQKWIDEPSRHLDTVSDCDCGEDHAPSAFLVADPSRLLAECEAKRRIVELCDGFDEQGREVRQLLALPYAEHPDYRETWRP